MHWYEIPEGTRGKLLVQEPDTDIEVRNWITRKDLSFTETVHDPIAEENGRLADAPADCLVRELAQAGYAIFGGEVGSESTAKYLLAVPYAVTQLYQRERDY